MAVTLLGLVGVAAPQASAEAQVSTAAVVRTDDDSQAAGFVGAVAAGGRISAPHKGTVLVER